MLMRLLELHYQGLNERQITADLQREFDSVPEYVGETKAELMSLKSGMYPHLSFFAAHFPSLPIALNGERQRVFLANRISGPKANQWNSAMEAHLKEYVRQGMEVNDITNELFHEFAKPQSGYSQETYRQIQAMEMKGEL